MDRIINALDGLPVATIITVLVALGGLYELLTGHIDYEHFLVGLGVASGGSAALGHVRNDAGKGIVTTTSVKRARPRK